MNQSCFYPVSRKLGLAADISAGILNEFQVGTDDDTSSTPGLCGDPFLMEEWIDGGTNYKDMACEPQVPLPHTVSWNTLLCNKMHAYSFRSCRYC